MKTPDDKTIAFTFHSHPTKNRDDWWVAKVTFPPGSTAETVLPISITDEDGNPIKSATFEFAGKSLKVENGASSLTFAEFIAGKHSVPIWLHRAGMEPVPGFPTFA
jgi:hypothetical protein